jgi:sulfonate transport system substrate-binding protein
LRRHLIRIVLPVLLVLSAVAACGGAPSSTSTGGSSDAPLRVGVIVAGSAKGYGIESWAYQQGILQKHLASDSIGSVQFIAFPNGPNLNQALKGGSLDLGVLGDTPAISGRAADLPTQLSGVSVRGQDAWLIAGKGISSVADLAGKTVATQQGSYMHRYLVSLLAQAGLTSSVKVSFLLVNAAQQALDKGDIAAYAAPVPTAPLLQSKGYAVIDKASEHPGLAGNSYITIGKDAAAKYPNLARDWNAGIADAATKIAADPSSYYDFAAQTGGLPLAVVKQAYPTSEFGNPDLTATDVTTVQTTLDFLVTQKLAAGPFDVASWIAPGVSAS